MKHFVAKLLRKAAPQTFENLTYVSRARNKSDDVMGLLRAYETEVEELKKELNEMRRDQRRMAELYDLVFERIRNDNSSKPAGTPTGASDNRR